jgi:hypothetical protein
VSVRRPGAGSATIDWSGFVCPLLSIVFTMHLRHSIQHIRSGGDTHLEYSLWNTSRSIPTVVVSSLLLLVLVCAWKRSSRDILLSHLDHFVRQAAGKSILPRLLRQRASGLGVQCTLDCPASARGQLLTHNLLLFVSGARWQAKSRVQQLVRNNYSAVVLGFSNFCS